VLEFDGHRVDNALVVDDQEPAREAYEDTVQDAGLSPILEGGPVHGDPATYVGQIQRGPAAALLCDQMLRHRNYASFEGAALVAACYAARIPAVLCTDYGELIDDIRPWRRWIPSLRRPDELDPDELIRALEEWIFELTHGFRAHRAPWRTLIKVLDVTADERRFLVEVPAWTSTVIPVKFTNVPVQVQQQLRPDFRCRARVNLGAYGLDEIYFDQWELAP
jgi:hypothetical protein